MVPSWSWHHFGAQILQYGETTDEFNDWSSWWRQNKTTAAPGAPHKSRLKSTG
jgi:hypothetical protein